MSRAKSKFGKHIIDCLTQGMYSDPRMIFREYIQNAADQIDSLCERDEVDEVSKTITIHIDVQKKSIVITDHATGIPQKEFESRMINVADSWKDPERNKGFRGIGRLAGISYCRKLTFETSARNESNVSKIVWDGDKVRRILNDNSDHSTAEEVVGNTTTITTSKSSDPDYECFFKVTLEDVLDCGEDLLDVDSIKAFIAEVAPVPFYRTAFSHSEKIMKHAEALGYPIDEYTIKVNGECVRKPYKDNLYGSNGEAIERVVDVYFGKIESNGRLLAWYWVGVYCASKTLVASMNPERKLRLRKYNIQIGFSSLLDSYFPEGRSNGYLVGEIHLVDKDVRPSADRNGLDVNSAANKFQKSLRTQLAAMWKVCREANSYNALHAAIKEYGAVRDKFDKTQFPTESIHEAQRKHLEVAYEKAKKAHEKLQFKNHKKPNNDLVASVRKSIELKYNKSPDKIPPLPEKTVKQTTNRVLSPDVRTILNVLNDIAMRRFGVEAAGEILQEVENAYLAKK